MGINFFFFFNANPGPNLQYLLLLASVQSNFFSFQQTSRVTQKQQIIVGQLLRKKYQDLYFIHFSLAAFPIPLN